MGGRILAIRESRGYRPVLVVREVLVFPQYNANPPRTVLAGQQVVLPNAPTGGIAATYSDVTYNEFLSPNIGKPLVWCQLRSKHESLAQFYERWPQLPITPVACQTVVMLSSGIDPLHGAWVQFAGSINPLFSQPRWWEEPEYGGDDDFYPEPPNAGNDDFPQQLPQNYGTPNLSVPATRTVFVTSGGGGGYSVPQVNGEIPDGLINDVNQDYVLSKLPLPGSLHLYLGGIFQYPGVDYTIDGVNIHMTIAPPEDSDLWAIYNV